MTLKKQLFLSITLIFLLLLIGSLLVNLKNEQQRLKEQLALHAQETATSLAFSLSTATANGQQALMNSMVDVIFDSGYYQKITFTNTQGQVILERERVVKVEGVPAWFLGWHLIPKASGSAAVMSGWRQLGKLEVVIHPGLASREFWLVIREQSILFIGIAFMACLSAAGALKVLLKPLLAVEKQAEAVCQKQFIEQPVLPRTRELRQVVLAMNRMARKLKEIFAEQLELIENLRVQSYIDPVTKLSTRSHFNALLQSVIDRQEKTSGILLLMQVSNFSKFNLQNGREVGDECLRMLAQKLQQIFSECPDAIIGRRGGVDFAVYLPGFLLARAKELATQYLKWAEDADFLKIDNIYLPIHIGISFASDLKRGHTLFNEADLALGQAQSQGENNWQVYHEENVVEVVRQANQWFHTLQQVIEKKRITFHYQPLFNRRKEIVASEALCRIQDGENIINAGIFFPMVDRFGLSEQFDKLILERIADMVSPQSVTRDPSSINILSDKQLLTVNISAQTLVASDFPNWVDAFLQRNPHLARHLVLETAEHSVAVDEKALRNVCAVINKHGSSFSLDHFGVHAAAFSYLQSFPLQSLKIDRTFIKNIHENSDNQFYVKALAQIAHSRDILVYAEGVEKEEEWACILELGLDGAQGFYLCKPSDKLIS